MVQAVTGALVAMESTSGHEVVQVYPVYVKGVFENYHLLDEVSGEVGMDEVGSNVEDHGWEVVWVLCGEEVVHL